MEMITPPQLKEGDSVYILSTARKISKEELDPAIQELESWGLTIVLGKSIGASDDQFAGNDQLRITDFNTAIHDSKVKAIMCARGGYGSVRIVDQIDWNQFKKTPKWITGYSDVTTIHNHIHNLGIKSIHSTMPINHNNNTKESWSTLRAAFFSKALNVLDYPHTVHRKGEMKGQVIGGNLSILYSLLGSESAIDTKGKILFIEDLDEYLYHIDRMMMNLNRNDYFKGLSGLIIGGMTDMNDNAIPFGKTALEIIFGHVKGYDFPVIYNFPVGHLDDNRAIIFGENITMKIDMKIEIITGKKGKTTIASQDILKGEEILKITGEETLVRNRFSVQVGEDLHINPVAEGGKYMNHSCDPNSFMNDERFMIANRNIAKGEEISFDYSTTEDVIAEKFICACGSEQCRGEIVGRLEK